MANSRSLLNLLLITVCLSAVGSAKPTAAQEPPSGIKCVKREAVATPPRAVLPSVRPVGGKEQEHEAAPKLKPVCPEGEVPVPVAPSTRHFIKGNPMLRSYAAPGPAQPLPGDFVNHNLLRPFDQTYWKRDGKPTPSRSKPIHGSGDPPCDGMAWFGSCFYYGTAAEQVVADGGGMTLQIEAPKVVGDDDHSIGEIAVMGPGGAGGSLDDVEMGFSVSSGQWGDNKSHLFVYHWNDGNETCYDTCNWNQVSNTYYPGMDLTPLVGKFVYIGWVQYREAWWAWFNDQWLGYINNSAWTTAFTKTAQIQWYGEVASNNGIPPQTQMGDGQFPAKPTAAGMTTLCYVNAKAWVCYYNDSQSTGATDTNYYDIQNHTSFGAVRYGGPGQ
ncbi:MAG: neprosin family prolyl endopeptidase [Xanthobacteraceae bacterium]